MAYPFYRDQRVKVDDAEQRQGPAKQEGINQIITRNIGEGKMRLFGILVVAIMIVLGSLAVDVPSASADSSQITRGNLYYFNPFPVHGSQVQGAHAKIVTNDTGASMELHTSGLTPGHAITIWWVIFNNPEACAGYNDGAPCTMADLMGNAAAVGSEVTYATGHVIGESGQGHFGAHLPIGATPNGWFGNGFTNPRGAEIHLVVHTHGPLIPEIASNMISTFRGGCHDDWFINEAHPAYTDGIPGPNECVDLQFAVLKQTQ